MRISGRLSETTLGDVLGALLRGKVTGLLRLTETHGSTSGRVHGIYLSRGAVAFIDTPAKVPSLGDILRQRGLLDAAAQLRIGVALASPSSSRRRVGEVLVDQCQIAPEVVGAALRQQLRARLELLFRLQDANLSFHVACSLPGELTEALMPRDYLQGRPRARDRGPHVGRRRDDAGRARRSGSSGSRRASLAVLGLDEDASLAEVGRAFRELAKEAHPDRHVHAPESHRHAMQQRFAALSVAYHALMGAPAAEDG